LTSAKSRSRFAFRGWNYLSDAPQAEPQAVDIAFGLSPEPQAEPQATLALSPEPQAEPQAVPTAFEDAFVLQPMKLESAICLPPFQN
jgi:hypothetical protein